MLIIRESDLRNPFDVLAALARRCETTDYDATDGWHVLMAIKHLQKQRVEADDFRKMQPWEVYAEGDISLAKYKRQRDSELRQKDSSVA
jgi:hypothetical protein